MKVTFRPPALWPHQAEFVDHPSRFTVCKSATKCGKTVAAAWWLAREAARKPGGLFWWVGPTNEVGLIGYSTVKHFLSAAIVKATERPWKFRLSTGTMVALKSAQDPDLLRGAGVSAMVLDEAGSPVFDDAWPEIRTTIEATRGRLKIIGNPGDAGSFSDNAETWGLDPEMPDWSFRRWRFTDRPCMEHKPDEGCDCIARALADAAKELGGEDNPDFRRYYLGETIRGEGAFFYGLDRVATGEPEGPREGEQYVIGVDCSGSGANADFFVASVWRRSDNRQVAVSRYKGPPSEQQADEIVRLSKEFNDAIAVVEVNGPGGPIYQDVVRAGVPAFGFNTQAKSKTEALYDYRSDISNQRIVLLSDAYQMREHLQFQRKRSGFGNERLTAPSGGHDDLVMANAFAVHALRRVVSPEILWAC